MPTRLMRSLTLVLAGFALGTGAAIAQTTAPAETAGPQAEFKPAAVLVAGGAPLGADAAIEWELLEIGADGRAGAPVAYGKPGAVMSAPPGDYILLAKLDLAFGAAVVTLTPGMNAMSDVVLNAGLLQLTPEMPLGGAVLNGGAVHLVASDGGRMSYVGPVQAYVPAGPVQATVVFDAVRMQQTLNVAAGETVTASVVAEAGIAELRLTTGGFTLPEGLKPRIDIFEAPLSPDAPLKMVVYDMLFERSFLLPPGDYVAQGLVEGASLKVPFSVKAGEVVPVAIDLAVGMLKVSAPEANSLAVMRATDNVAEPWRMIFHQFDLTELEYVVPEGDYLIEARFANGVIEKTTSVGAGALVELTVP